MHRIRFPDPRLADPDGLVAIGGDYRPETLIAAYAQGIFPWPCGDLSHAWFSPDPRFVLLPEELRVSRSLRKTLRRAPYRITFDHAFEEVIHACATSPRPDHQGTWIHPDLIEGFVALHRSGVAHSVEAWHGSELAGGLYGIALGAAFAGESMFFRQPDASKAAFVHLVEHLRDWSFHFVDCQVPTEHLERFGATEWPRDRFLDALSKALEIPTRLGPWHDENRAQQE
ncbi:MAG: leucyl/phenylalanyl-tRNA--protein transferase [Acidobacteriota bacterium]